MRYDISKQTAPTMPTLGKGTECIKLLLSQASKEMSETLVQMSIPALASHLSNVEFMYSDNLYYELCGQMGHLIGPSGIGKAQLTHLIEAIMRPFREHNKIEFQKHVDWQRQMKTKAATWLQGLQRLLPHAAVRLIPFHIRLICARLSLIRNCISLIGSRDRLTTSMKYKDYAKTENKKRGKP